MSNRFNFESEPFETHSEVERFETFDTELTDEEWEGEAGRRQLFPVHRVRYRPIRRPPPRPPIRPPRPPRPPQRPRPIWAPPVVLAEPPGAIPVAEGSEYVRWVQSTLNQVMGLRLPVDGIIGPETRSAVRDFQRREGLPVDGIVGPPTERALAAAGGQAAPAEEESFGDVFGRITSGIGSVFDRVVDVVGGASGSRIIDLTAKADKSQRKRTRDPKSVYALVLHQMACCFKVKDPLKRFLSLGSHFAILPDGRILQLHPITALVWASNGFNKGSVAVEFAGNFPNTRGKWWKGDQYGRNQVTQAQIEAGRYLVRYLIRTMGLTHILAHRQSSGTRENDPGPDIWYHVGQWAIENLGLKDGGSGFKIDSGNPIPDEWRNWGRRGSQPELMVRPFQQGTAIQLQEEIDPETPDHVEWLQRSLNHILGLRLPENGILGPATRSAVRSFQSQRKLDASGVLNLRTERSLMAAGATPHRHPARG